MPKMGILIWSVVCVILTTTGMIGVFIVFYLMVLTLWDYLGVSLDTTVGIWATQVKRDTYEFAANYSSLCMAIGTVFVLLSGASLPYIMQST